MPRIRTIKPEFWASEQIGECSSNARLLFIGLWNFADDYGVHPDKPKELKAKLFPYDDATTSEARTWIDELVKQTLLRRFDANGATYLHVTGWEKHQRIDKRNEEKRHPDPTKFSEHSPTIPGLIQERSRWKGRERKGEEGNGEDGTFRLSPSGRDDSGPAEKQTGPEPQSKRLVKLAKDWKPSEGEAAFAIALGFTPEEVARHAVLYAGYWTTGGGAGERRSAKSWVRTWQNWVRRETDKQRTRPASNGTGKQHLTAEQRKAAIAEGIRRAREEDQP